MLSGRWACGHLAVSVQIQVAAQVCCCRCQLAASITRKTAALVQTLQMLFSFISYFNKRANINGILSVNMYICYCLKTLFVPCTSKHRSPALVQCATDACTGNPASCGLTSNVFI